MHPTWLEELVRGRTASLHWAADRARRVRQITKQPDHCGALLAVPSARPLSGHPRPAGVDAPVAGPLEVVPLHGHLAAPTGADNDGCEASVHYEIRIQGRLDQRWSSWFDGLTVANEPDSVTTPIAWPVADQAALHGLLAKIRDLGLPLVLVSVRRIDPAVPGGREGGATVSIGHDHAVGWFDAGHCQACAREAGLLDHYDRVQREEARQRQAREWAWTARRWAIWALVVAAAGVVLAVVSLLSR